jgi:hypothetical protein
MLFMLSTLQNLKGVSKALVSRGVVRATVRGTVSMISLRRLWLIIRLTGRPNPRVL